MLANDITLDNADGTDVIYRLLSQAADGSRRIDIASNLSTPSILSIKHSVSGKVPNIVDRHLVQLSKTLATATGSVTPVINFTLTVPRDAAVTTVVMHNMVSNLLDLIDDGALTGFASTANIDAVLRGES